MGYFWQILSTVLVWIIRPFVILVLRVHLAFSSFENLSKSSGISSKLDEMKLVASVTWNNLMFSFWLGILKPLNVIQKHALVVTIKRGGERASLLNSLFQKEFFGHVSIILYLGLRFVV